MTKAMVLVIDGGGRGAALVDKYSQSPKVAKILAIPGNDLMGIYTKKPVQTFPEIKTTDIGKILKIAQKNKVDLVDVAQDDAVAVGATNLLKSHGLKVFGPTKEAGQIEWDKAFSRNFMKKFKIPSPSFKVCHLQKDGIAFIKSQMQGEWYVKASGLAAGKGAIHAQNKDQAFKAVKEMNKFGKAGKTFLIEQCLKGEEFSSYAIVDGKDFIIVGHAQDHKTVYNADIGPNTGGMGATSPPVLINKKIEKQIKSIFKKTAEGLVNEKRPYLGVLYLGGIVDASGKVFVIEFNARWGDPEAQVIIPSIKNDFFEIADATIEGKLKKLKIKKDNFYWITVTSASAGYPQDYTKSIGKIIFGLKNLIGDKKIKVYGAGVKEGNGHFKVAGGRLFYVTAKGKNIIDARKTVYDALMSIFIENNSLHYRTDIGHRDLERLIHDK